MKPYPTELNKVEERGANMGAFVPLLYKIACSFPPKFRTILEIGVRWGTSTNAFLYGIRDRGHQNLFLHSIDTDDCSRVVRDPELKKWWNFIQGDSRTVPWDLPVDVLLIDGDHSLEGVKADYERFEPFVREGGLILFHDVCWPNKGVVSYWWDHVHYPKSYLPLTKSGLGIANKVFSPYYDPDRIKPYNRG